MIDLTTARNCIEAMKENGTYRSHKIGRVINPIGGMTSAVSGFPVYQEGEIVIFRKESSPEEYREKHRDTLTVESPLSLEQINKNREEGSLITTIRTTVCVPEKYVEEIRISFPLHTQTFQSS
jgi:hypothetical protein